MALDSRDRLRKALNDARWIISEAARDLGVSRQAIYDAMRRHRIQRRKVDAAVYREVRIRSGSMGGRPPNQAAA